MHVSARVGYVCVRAYVSASDCLLLCVRSCIRGRVSVCAFVLIASAPSCVCMYICTRAREPTSKKRKLIACTPVPAHVRLRLLEHELVRFSTLRQPQEADASPRFLFLPLKVARHRGKEARQGCLSVTISHQSSPSPRLSELSASCHK